MRKLLGKTVGVAILSLVMANISLATTMSDSANWEGAYEASVLPSAAGFTCVTENEATFASVADGALTINVPGTANAAIFFQKNASFNFASGASVEWRVKLVTYDSWNIWASHLLIADNTGGAVVSSGSPIETYTSAGVVEHTSFPTGLGDWNTVRLTAENGVVNIYINGVLDTVSLGSPSSAWLNAGSFVRFGDVTADNDAITQIDYVRWTTQGAFAVPEPASLIVFGLAGLILKSRRKRA